MDQKPQLQKERQEEKAEGYVPDEGKDKTQEKQLNEVEIGNLPEKEFRMIVKMIQDLGKKMEAKIEKMQEIFNKDLEELRNKQTGFQQKGKGSGGEAGPEDKRRWAEKQS